ncbi:MAG: hypothetical protein JST60_18040 [Chloroflexi bacterium SZAS-1]|jgi:hypothetical protein|nr:hypothetical protein [Chloroflexi bacterium SZAS-1]HNP86620.1 hypothetical protein [Kouleothrix sp.]
MLDMMLYIFFIVVLLAAARWIVVFLFQALASLVQVLVSLAGTVVLAGVFILLLASFLH